MIIKKITVHFASYKNPLTVCHIKSNCVGLEKYFGAQKYFLLELPQSQICLVSQAAMNISYKQNSIYQNEVYRAIMGELCEKRNRKTCGMGGESLPG